MPDVLEGQGQAEIQQQPVAAPVNIQQNQDNPDPLVAAVPGQVVAQPEHAQRRRSKAGRWTLAHSRMLGDMSRNPNMTAREWEQNAGAAIGSAEEIIKEFNTKGSVGWYSRYKRKKAFKGKMELTAQCRALNNNADEPPVQNSLSLMMIKNMMDEDADYLDFKDDKDFIKKYDKNYAKIIRFAGIDPDTLNTYLEENKPFLNEAGIYYSIDEIRKQAGKFSKVERYYRAKRDMIASPFYSVLTSEDTDKIGDDRLRSLSDPESAVKSGHLKSYLKNVAELRDLQRDGIARTGKEKNTYSYKKKVSGKHGGTRGYISFGNVSSDLKLTLKGSTTHSREKDVYNKDGSTIEKNIGDKVESTAKIETSVEGNAVEAGFKGKKRNKYGEGSWDGKLEVGHFKVYSNVGGSLIYSPKKGEISGWGGAETGAEVSAVKGKIGASYTSHNDLHGVYGNAEGEALFAKAYAMAKVGTFKIPGVDGGEPIEIKNGYAFMAGAQVGLAKGSVSGGFKIFGVKIGATLTGTAGGAGAQVGMYKSEGKVGVSLGLAALVGFKLDINIDFSELANKFKEKFFRKFRSKKKK